MKEQKEEPGFSYEEFEKEAIKGLYEGKSYVGDKGVFTPLIKHFLEKALSLEIEQHLKETKGNKLNRISS